MMKKLMIFASAAMLLAGCAKENIDIGAPYVTFSAESEQTFSWNFKPEFTLGKGQYFEYRVGGGDWNRFKTTVSEIPFGGSQGDLQLRGISSQGTAAFAREKWTTISFGNAEVPVCCSGDIRTLVNYKNCEKANTSNARFCGLFSGCTQLTSAPELPAMDLATRCYDYMFYDCESLKTAPELPATTLTDECYFGMFRKCSTLTSTPELPAIVLANACYYGMFAGCTALETAQDLPATTLADCCYTFMFADCASLTKTPVLSDAQLAYGCYSEMFSQCGNLSEVWIKAKPSFTDENEKAEYAKCFLNWLLEAGTNIHQGCNIYCTQEFYECFGGNEDVIPSMWLYNDIALGDTLLSFPRKPSNS